MWEVIMQIFQSGHLYLIAVISLGIILVVLGAAPQLLQAVSKQEVTLTGRQAWHLMTIGTILIVFGAGGLAWEYISMNHPPNIKILNLDPQASQIEGLQVALMVIAEDPDKKDSLEYEFWLQGPATGNKPHLMWGPTNNNSWIWNTNSGYLGENQIIVKVYDRPQSDPDLKTDNVTSDPYRIYPKNREPEINNISACPSSSQFVGKEVRFCANANDPDEDTLYFMFLKDGPNDDDFVVTRDWKNEKCWIWNNITAEDIGQNWIKVRVTDDDPLSSGDKEYCDDEDDLMGDYIINPLGNTETATVEEECENSST